MAAVAKYNHTGDWTQSATQLWEELPLQPDLCSKHKNQNAAEQKLHSTQQQNCPSFALDNFNPWRELLEIIMLCTLDFEMKMC